MNGEILDEAEVFDFEARNPRPRFRVGKVGDVFSLDVEIDEELWNTLKLIPRGAIIRGKLFWSHEDEGTEQATKATRKAPEVTPWGRFWQRAHAKGLLSNLDLCEVLELNDPRHIKKKLHEHFKVDSLRDVDPQLFEDFCERAGLGALVAQIARIRRDVQEQYRDADAQQDPEVSRRES